MVAHRLSTIVDADLIYVMEAGRVLEHGTHEELIGRGGLYARLHAMQFSGEAAEPGETPEREADAAPAQARLRGLAG
jgi:hypothetical protein